MQIYIKTIISFLTVAFSNPVASLHTQVRTLKSCNLCQILHSTPYFFILVFSTAFYDRSRMTGRYLLPKKRNSPLPSFLSGRQNRNDDGRKNIM